MSNPRELAEHTTAELLAELARRTNLERAGLCSYCGQPRRTKPVCKLLERHNLVELPWYEGEIVLDERQVGVAQARRWALEQAIAGWQQLEDNNHEGGPGTPAGAV